MTYKIVRTYQYYRNNRIIKTGLTLEQAKAWCNNPETSSSTATKPQAKRRTERLGAWFDEYEEEKI